MKKFSLKNFRIPAPLMAISTVIALLAFSCKNQQTADGPARITVKWEAVTNFTDDPDRSEAMFLITNKGEDLTNMDWGIYFSKSPVLVTAPDTGMLHIEHLNGDWYRISPRPGFVLRKGDSIRLHYQATGHYIKLSDAPMGMYIAFHDADENVTRTAPITQLEIVPFSRQEQLLRGSQDGEEAFSTGKLYRANAGLSLVSEAELLPIIPSPYRIEKAQGTYNINKNLSIAAGEDLSFEADYLKTKIAELNSAYKASLSPTATAGTGTSGEASADIRMGLDQNLMDGLSGAYRLAITPTGIDLTGADAAGVFYGVQSLLALLYNQPDNQAGTKDLSLPALLIHDKPRFGFRSLHMDVSRNFQTKETVLRTLDIMAHYKLNNFLFYISEDEAWRLEIPGLPELTEVGSKRIHPPHPKARVVHPAYGSGISGEAENQHGNGHYSVQDFVDILKYAHDRHINVVPALNFPGHARAAIMAMEHRYEKYQQAGEPAKAEEYRLLDPEDRSVYLSAQHFKDNVVNVSRESAYRFYEKVVDELTKMYGQAGAPFPIMHAGGDEVARGAWSGSPEVQAWAARKGIPGTYSQIQAAFFGELVSRLEKRGLEVHGWEETGILHTADDQFLPNPAFVGRKVVPYIWNNLFDYPDMGYRMANIGYEVVLCNVSNFYFDLAHDNDPREPGLTWGGFVDVRDAWAFAPYELQNTTFKDAMGQPMNLDRPGSGFERLRPDARKNIRGLQAQLWAETIKGGDMFEYYMLPKLIGFAETTWARERAWESMADRPQRLRVMEQEWNVFANSIGRREFAKLSRWNGGYHFRVPTVGLHQDAAGLITANVELPGLDIRYTTDGSEPTASSPRYEGPIAHQPGMKFRAFAFGRSGFTKE